MPAARCAQFSARMWIAAALVAAVVLGGCAATLTGAWVLPRAGRVTTGVATGDLPTVFVSATISFTTSADIMPAPCAGGDGQ